MKILITGDFFVADKYQNKELFDYSVLDLFKSVDYRLINLESPVTENIDKIIKTGPHLRSTKKTISRILKDLNVDLVTLANNHILDHGETGILDTLEFLKQEEISHVGAGINLKEASKNFCFEKNNHKFSILNFAENEWSIAGNDSPGANPLDTIDNVKQIQLAKANGYTVICIIHGGHEFYNLPSPLMVKRYKFYVDNGADVIIGHHPHCISGYEVYKNAPIVYSLGNFIFTKNSTHEDWYKGLVMILEIDESDKITFELKPVIQNNISHKLSLSDTNETKLINDRVKFYSEIISDNVILQEEWNSFIKKKSMHYLGQFNAINGLKNKYLISALRKLRIDRLFFSKYYFKFILNILSCEAHLEASKSVIIKYLNK